MKSWKIYLSDYEWRCWDAHSFDFDSIPYVREAYNCKKWAFVSDYVRIYALYTYGGIYLDTDIFMKKRFDSLDLYDVDFFSAIEYHPQLVKKVDINKFIDDKGHRRKGASSPPGIGIQAAVLGAAQGHPYLKDILEYYKDKHFLNIKGEPDMGLIAPAIYAMIAEKYGFVYQNREQSFSEGMKIFSSDLFAGGDYQERTDSILVHRCAHSWYDYSRWEKIKIWVKAALAKMYSVKKL